MAHLAHAVAWPRPGRRLLILVGLTGFAISQPLLSVLGENPATIASHGVDGTLLVVLVVALALVPPLVLWLLLRAIDAINPRAGRALYLVVVAALAACFVLQVAKGLGIDQPVALVILAGGAGASLAVAHVRRPALAAWASYTSCLPALAAGMFLFASPASALVSTPAAPEATATGGDYPSVVFIVLDELPTRSLLDEDGGMDAERFPNLAAFADDATWYRRHTALAPLTSAAVPSLLSGQLPTVEAPLFANHPDNLFTLLAPTHELEVFEAVTTLCPYESCVATRTDEQGQEEVIDDGAPGVRDLVDVTVDLWLDRISLGPDEPALLDDYAEEEASVEPERSDIDLDDGDRGDLGVGEESVEATSVRAEAFMDTLDATKGPSLYYLHLMLPHQPWARHPDGEIYSVTDPVAMTLPADDKEIAFSWSDWIGAVSEQRHLLQAQYTDELLGQIMGELRAEGLYDDSLVIVTADHGVSFEPRTSARYVTASTVDAIAYSPLLVKRPGQSDGAVDDANVMAFDVVPTVADLVGVVPSWSMDGSVIGSPAIDARGGRKRIDDVSGLGDLSLDEVLEWDDEDEAPSASDRWIGRLDDPSEPLSGLDRLLDARDLLGTRLDDHDPGDGELRAHIDQVGLVRTPIDDVAPLGLVSGRVEGAPAGAEVVLAIDGVIVGGSKLSTDSDGNDGRIAILLPQGTLQEANEVRVALVVDGEVLELEVTG